MLCLKHWHVVLEVLRWTTKVVAGRDRVNFYVDSSLKVWKKKCYVNNNVSRSVDQWNCVNRLSLSISLVAAAQPMGKDEILKRAGPRKLGTHPTLNIC